MNIDEFNLLKIRDKIEFYHRYEYSKSVGTIIKLYNYSYDLPRSGATVETNDKDYPIFFILYSDIIEKLETISNHPIPQVVKLTRFDLLIIDD